MHLIILFSLILLFLISPSPTYAHAFGQSYTLPVPFWLYAYGAAGALVVSFLIVGFFISEKKGDATYPRLDITEWKIISFLRKRSILFTLQILSLLLFLLTILTGFLGTSVSTANFSMTFFWIIFLPGLTYLTAIIGNIYSALNPWKTVAELVERFTDSSLEKGTRIYPKHLGYVPAFLGYFFFIWIELVGRFDPSDLALALVGYSLFTLIGMYFYGKKVWFEKGEFFSVFFRLVSRVGIIQYENKKFYLQPPFVGLLKEKAENFSLVVFIVFMLSSTAFDGFRDTLRWADIYFMVIQSFGSQLGMNVLVSMETIGLLLSIVFFLAIYIILVLLMKVIIRSRMSIKDLSIRFAFSLIPIGLVYNVAHYYTLFLIQGQSILKLVSDPFGYGWNLFGTANMKSQIGIIDTNIVWHSQVLLILFGHVAAVYLAHLIALEIFPTHKKAIISQFPMLILMVIYTMTGLWILSQPLMSGF